MLLAGAVALPAAATVIFQDGFEAPICAPTNAPKNSPGWVLGTFASRAKVVNAASGPYSENTVQPVVMDGAQVLRASTAGATKQGGQHDFNLMTQYSFYNEIWWNTLTMDGSGASAGFQGMAFTLNVGGPGYHANWLSIGNTGTQKGLTTKMNFHYKARYGVNWGGGQNNWWDTGVAIPDNKWVKLGIGYTNLDTTKTVGEYTMVTMSISWDNQLQWTRSATIDNSIAGSELYSAQIGTAPTATAWAVAHVDNYLATDGVPEPASFLALLSGLGCVGLVTRRRR